MLQSERKIRIFISSTFRDMMMEREYLLKRIFPQLHRWCIERHIEMTEVDLRWGITEEEAKEGKVIEICINEIDKSRPFFIGILGDRYGWIPNEQEIIRQQRLFEQFPWLKDDIYNGLSITDIEMQYGVLRSPEMMGNAFFYIKEEACESSEKVCCTEIEQKKLKQLKKAVKEQNKFPVSIYENVNELGEMVLEQLKKAIEHAFPEDEVPDELTKQRLDHIGFIKSRVGVYIKNNVFFSKLDQQISDKGLPVIISGESGSGKSALLSNWIMEHAKEQPDQYMFYHFCGCNHESSDLLHMLTRLLKELNLHFALNKTIPTDLKDMIESLPYFLAETARDEQWILIIDAVNQLNYDVLSWLPESFPESVHVILSTTPGLTYEQLKKRNWTTLELPLLDETQKEGLIREYLSQYSKHLQPSLEAAIVKFELSSNALLLRTLLDELRIFGLHEGLPAQVRTIIKAKSAEAFFNLILKRLDIEYDDADSQVIQELLTLIWASEKGLSEHELLSILKITRLQLSQILSELDHHLISMNGLLCFSHDYLRNAVEHRYLKTEKSKVQRHRKLIAYFETTPYYFRSLEELPYQLQKAKEWKKCKDYLTDIEVFSLIYSKDPYRLCYYWKELSKKYAIFHSYRKSYLSHQKTDLEYNQNVTESIGSFLELASEYSGAAWFYYDSKRHCEEKFGRKHQQTGIIYGKLAKIYNILNLYGKSLYASRTSLQIQEEVLGEHPDMVDNYNNIADIYWNKRDFDNALKNNKKALELCIKYLGMNHEKTAKTYQEIGWVYEAQGEYKNSLEHLLKASAILKKRYGENSPQYADCITTLAWVYDWLGDYNKLFELAKKSHEIYQYAYGERHSETGLTYKLLGTGYYRLGEYEKACSCYEKSKEIWTRIYGEVHSRPSVACFQIGLACIKTGNYTRAIKEIEQSIQIEKEIAGEEAADLAISFNHLGLAFTLSGDYENGIQNLTYGMQEGMNYYGKNSNDVAESNYYLGIYYYLTNELHKSIQYILDSYGIRKELYGQENPETALSIYFLGKLYEKIGEQNIAIKHQAEACEIFTTYHTMHLKLEIDTLVSPLIH